MACNRNLYNIIMLGVAFMLLFTAFQTTSMAETSVLIGEQNITGGNFTGNGYTSLSIIYGTFAAANWIAPVIVTGLGARLSMVISAVIYDLFIASFLMPNTALLYTGSALLGIAAAVIWTAQGNYLAMNSNPNTSGRNSGIFWALLQTSLLIGNIYLNFDLQGKTQIVGETRTRIFLVFTACGGLGTLCFILLRKPQSVTDYYLGSADDDEDETLLSVERRSTLQIHMDVFISSFKLMATKRMLLLMFTFGYTGLELTFFSGVYGTCLGNTKAFGGNAKSYIGLSGMFIGVGEIVGGLVFGILGKRTVRFGRDAVVVLGYVVHMACFYLIYISVPAHAPIRPTAELPFLKPDVYIAMVSAFLLGLGDSCFNTQIFSFLSDKYKEQSAAAFALFKFMQSLCAAIGFAYSLHLILKWQLLILVITGTAGVLAYSAVEWISRPQAVEEQPIQAE